MLSALLFLLAQDPFQISVQVDLVVVHTSVRDRDKRLVTDLAKPDFQIFEDGVKQSVRVFQNEDVPITVGLVIDHSGSMRRKLKEVVEAARTFIQSSRPDDEMFVVNFNEHVVLGLPPTVRFSNRAYELTQAISNTRISGQTALYDALSVALDQLRSSHNDKRALVVISDGGDNRSRHKLDQILTAAEETSTLIYTIGIFEPGDPDQNPAVLEKLARSTGGQAYLPKHLEDVIEDCAQIAQDLRHQYALGYVSSKPSAPGVHHRIQVKATAEGHSGLVVRARSGYITPEVGSK